MDINIQHQDNETEGRFFAQLDPESMAEITYKKLAPDLRVCNHTGVPEAYRGQKIAFDLLLALIEDARENHIKYVPLCPYVIVQFKRHPEWSDVFVKE